MIYLAEVSLTVGVLPSFDHPVANLLGGRVSAGAYQDLGLAALEARERLQFRRQAILSTIIVRHEVLLNLHGVYLVLYEVFKIVLSHCYIITLHYTSR